MFQTLPARDGLTPGPALPQTVLSHAQAPQPAVDVLAKDLLEEASSRPIFAHRRSLSLRLPSPKLSLRRDEPASPTLEQTKARALVDALRATPPEATAVREARLNALATMSDTAPLAVREALRYKFAAPRNSLAEIFAALRREMGAEPARRTVADLLEIGWDLRCAGKTQLVVVNATFNGGGVAELFQTCAEIFKHARIDMEWHTTLAADQRFTEIGRKVFDVLQGNDHPLSDEELDLWESENKRLGRIQQGVATDERVAAVFLEDHHPLHLIEQFQERRRAAGVKEPLKIVWRSHVDNANLLNGRFAAVNLWERAFKPQLQRLKPTDAALFQPGSVPRDVASWACGVFTQPPGTNPMAEKNVAISFEQMARILANVAPNVHLNRPYLVTGGRFVGWKGLLPMMRAHRRVMQKFPDIDHLMFGTVGSGDARKIAYYALVQAEAKDFAREYPAQAQRFQIVRDQQENIRAFYAKAKFDRMPIALMSIAEGYNMMADELTYQGALPMTTRQGGLSRFHTNRELSGITVDIADLVAELGDPASMYALGPDGRVTPTSPAAEALETRLAEHLTTWFTHRAEDPAGYAAQYDARAKAAHSMALEASNVAMSLGYLAMARADKRRMQQAKRDVRQRDSAAPSTRLVQQVMRRNA